MLCETAMGMLGKLPALIFLSIDSLLSICRSQILTSKISGLIWSQGGVAEVGKSCGVLP